MKAKDIELIKLKAKYEILSELESMFPTTSKHAVLLTIKKKMDQLLAVIEAQSKSEKNEFIGNFLQKAMKDHNLPHGIAYYNLLAEKSDLAEKAWARHRKKQIGK
jgi:enoyl-[acyl-carrier-protein] reductase (NADH)